MQIFRPRIVEREETEAVRFWRKVDRGHPMDCWEWLSTRTPAGYGYYRLADGYRTFYAHRRAFEISGGVLIEGMVIMHKCDNPPCCNPAHLTQGTHKDNTQDAIAKGRFRQHRRLIRREHCHKGHPFRVVKDGRRYCPECDKRRHREMTARRKERDDLARLA